MPRPSSRLTRHAAAVLALGALPACISVQRTESRTTPISVQSRESAGYALPCEGERVVELRNDGAHPVDVYAYRFDSYDRVFLRTLVRGSVETIPLGKDLLRVVSESSREAGAPAGTRSRVRTRYLCREG